MKLLLSLFFIAAVATSRGEDWTTTNGTTYKNVVVVKIESGSVTIHDADGDAVVTLSALPPEIQQRLSVKVTNPPASSPAQIAGQMFVVTKGGQNFKLGAIHIRAYRLSDVGPLIEAKREEAAPIIAKLRPVRSSLYDVLGKFSRLEIANVGKPEWYDDVSMEGKVKAKIAEVEKRLNDLSSGDYYLTNLPPPISDAQTDADGKFLLTVQGFGSYVLVASASRDVGEYTERYYWVVKDTVAEAGGKSILLTNENMIYTGSPDSLINEQ